MASSCTVRPRTPDGIYCGNCRASRQIRADSYTGDRWSRRETSSQAAIRASVPRHNADSVVRVGRQHSGRFTPLFWLHEHYVHSMPARTNGGFVAVQIDIQAGARASIGGMPWI